MPTVATSLTLGNKIKNEPICRCLFSKIEFTHFLLPLDLKSVRGRRQTSFCTEEKENYKCTMMNTSSKTPAVVCLTHRFKIATQL